MSVNQITPVTVEANKHNKYCCTHTHVQNIQLMVTVSVGNQNQFFEVPVSHTNMV